MKSPAFALLAVLALSATPVHSATIGACKEKLSLQDRPLPDEVKAHRPFGLPVIRYPFGTQFEREWGMILALQVDASGRPRCYSDKTPYGELLPLNPQRRAAIQKWASARYAPFLKNGTPQATVVLERIAEAELPQKHVTAPDVPLEAVRIDLARSACFGDCPSYHLQIRGDGSVTYRNDNSGIAPGTHTYTIPQADVKKLVDELRSKDIWSMRPSYHSGRTDASTANLEIHLGEETHSLHDYVGETVGMPPEVVDFENEVDRVAHSEMWVHLTQDTLDHLQAEGMKFDSPAAADLLARAIEDRWNDGDAALLYLLALGAPIVTAGQAPEDPSRPMNLLASAMRNHRSPVVDVLIAKGALNTGGKPDQKKIDEAFRMAISAGWLQPVQAIWNVAGGTPRPALDFDDAVAEGGKPKKLPVVLLLSQDSFHSRRENLAIAKWLAAQGCDLKARTAKGQTLLHLAAGSGDADFVRYLLDQGLDPSTPGPQGYPALGNAQNEEVAMLLLDAGTDISALGPSLGQHAEQRSWTRVIAWLKKHAK